jgi:tetratricopeptide (TPR) repeat protein
MTDERQIVALYDRLFQIQPSLVVELNRAVAIAMRDGPEVGLTHIDAVLEYRGLVNYYLAHSARADVYRRLGRKAKARSSYEKALALTQQDPARQFLRVRIRPLKYIDTSGTGAAPRDSPKALPPLPRYVNQLLAQKPCLKLNRAIEVKFSLTIIYCLFKLRSRSLPSRWHAPDWAANSASCS